MKYLLLLIFLCPIFSHAQNFKYGKVSLEEVKEKEHPKDPDANAAVLYKSESISYIYMKDRGFIMNREIQERIKIYNKEGFDWATKEVSVYNSGNANEEVIGLKGETYNVENGKLISQKLGDEGVFDEKLNKNWDNKKFTMPSIKAGSVIEYKYIVTSPFLSSIDRIDLQYTIPIEKLEVSVRIPEYFNFKKYLNIKSQLSFNVNEFKRNSTQTFSTMERNGGNVVGNTMRNSKLEYQENVYKIEKDNIPALKDEAHLDYLNNYAAFMEMELLFTKFPSGAIEYFSQTWNDVVEKIYESSDYKKEMEDSKYFSDELDALLVNTQQPEEKMNLIFDLVKSKVRWNNTIGYYTDNGVRDAFKDGKGNIADINIMLIAMLKYAGLNAYPVLLSTKSNGVPVYPTHRGFNYVVASVNIKDNSILLDASNKYNEPGMLPKIARNWLGRLIRDDGSSEWVDLMGKETSDNRTIVNVQIQEDLSMSGKVTNIFNGYYAKSFREKGIDFTSEDHIRELENGKGNIQIDNIETKNLEKLGDQVWETYDFELENAVDKINDKVYLKPLLFQTTNVNPFNSDKRIYPIFLDHSLKIQNTFNIAIPDDYEIVSIPENIMVNLKENSGSFKYVIAQTGKFLRVDTELQMNDIVYLPEDYETLKSFYNHLIEKNLETIVLQKTL